MKKIKIALIFGGKSAEHEIACLSARNIYAALDKSKYDVTLVGIDRKGRWRLASDAQKMLSNGPRGELPSVPESGTLVTMASTENSSELVGVEQKQVLGPIDVVFPIMHGPMGEDGTIQGLLKLMDLPFVGPGVLGSAIGMDKDVMKRLLREAGLPIANSVTLKKHMAVPSYSDISKKLGSVLFVKPANMGSSVGVSKVKDESQYLPAIKEAFRYDTKILIEEFIKGREVECSVLGNENPKASLPGELVAQHEFYSYEAKYIDENGAIIKIPADLPENVIKKVQDLAVRAFTTLECEGMSRVDFFLRDDNSLVINEINTIPGFTSISMYPKMWEASGLKYADLIDELIQLAIARYERDKKLEAKP